MYTNIYYTKCDIYGIKIYSFNNNNEYVILFEQKYNTMNLSENLCLDKELFSGTNVIENTMNLSENLCVDKGLFSGELCSKENTMNLSENLCVDKRLFSGELCSKENTIMTNEIIKEAKIFYEKLDENNKKNIKFKIYTKCESIDHRENFMIWHNISLNEFIKM
jgi:hypothetical protein